LPHAYDKLAVNFSSTVVLAAIVGRTVLLCLFPLGVELAVAPGDLIAIGVAPSRPDAI
jgi:hypothetical protein